MHNETGAKMQAAYEALYGSKALYRSKAAVTTLPSPVAGYKFSREVFAGNEPEGEFVGSAKFTVANADGYEAEVAFLCLYLTDKGLECRASNGVFVDDDVQDFIDTFAAYMAEALTRFANARKAASKR